jgi:predicted ATPase
VKKYVMRGGSFISNFDISPALPKKGKYLDKNAMMRAMKPKELIDSGMFCMTSIRHLKKSQLLYHASTLPKDYESSRGVWYWGAPGSGKTMTIRQEYGDSLYIKA